MRSMAFLAQTADEFDSIDNEEKEKAKFWYAQLMDNNPDDCCPEYVRKILDVYTEQRKVINNPNFDKLYRTFKKNMVEFCSGLFADLPTYLPTEHQTKLMELWNVYSRNGFAHHGKDAARGITKAVLRMINKGTRSPDAAVMYAWKNGPCEKAMHAMRQPEFKRQLGFIEMCRSEQSEMLEYCSERVREWIGIVFMCEHLDKLMPDIIATIDNEKALAKDLWSRIYEEVFGAGPSTPYPSKTDTELVLSVMFLNSPLQSRASDDDHKATAYIWAQALTDLRLELCDRQYLTYCEKIYEEQNTKNNPNHARILIIFKRTLLRYCADRFRDSPSRFAAQLSDEGLVNSIMSKVKEPNSDDEKLAQFLVDPFVKAIESGKKGEEAMNAWEQGYCVKILQAFKNPDLIHYHEYLDMIIHLGKDSRVMDLGDSVPWARVASLCQLLGARVTTWVGSSTSSLSQEIKSVAEDPNGPIRLVPDQGASTSK